MVTEPSMRITTRHGVPLQNHVWHTLNESPTVFVYVHGFFSSSNACWTSKSGVRWPDLVISDERLRQPSIFMSGFYTSVDSGDYRISDCAREVLEGLQRPGINSEPSPLTKKNIVFVCHSLGGIVTRYMLERHREIFSNKNIALVLIASPSFGSEYANSMQGIINLYKNKIAQQLTLANESLNDLDDRFRDLVSRKSIPNLMGVEAVEHHFPLHWRFIPALKPIVSKSSAARYFGASKLLQGTDHSTCVKPTSHAHVSHEFLVSTILEFYQRYVSLSATLLMSSTEKLPEKFRFSESPSLFEVYNAHDEPYYIHRDADNDVNKSMQVFSLWVFGESGLGKTAAVRRQIINSSIQTVQVYIGSSANTSEGHIALLKEIYYTLTSKFEVQCKSFSATHQVISEIATLLAKGGKRSSICLAIDEVPLIPSDDENAKFVQSIFALIVLLKQQHGVSDCRIVITSIFDPQKYLSTDDRRIFEQITFLKFKQWTDADLEKLISIIVNDVNIHNIGKEEVSKILGIASGSPRFVKNFFKNHLIAQSRGSSVDETLRETAATLRLNQSIA